MTDQPFNSETFRKAMKTLDPTPEEAARRQKMREFLDKLTQDPRYTVLDMETGAVSMSSRASPGPSVSTMKKVFDANYGGDAFPRRPEVQIKILPPGDEEQLKYWHNPPQLSYQPRRGMSTADIQQSLDRQLKQLGLPIRVSLVSGNRDERRRKARKDGSAWRRR